MDIISNKKELLQLIKRESSIYFQLASEKLRGYKSIVLEAILPCHFKMIKSSNVF